MTFLIMWAETRIMSYDGSQLSVCEWSFGCGVRTVCVQSKVYIVSLELRCWVFLSEFSQILIRVFIICVFHIMFYIISCNVIMSVFLLEQQQFFLKIFYKTQAGINVGETKLDEIVMLISQDVRAPCAKMSLQQCIRQVYEVHVSQTHVCRWSRFSRCDLVGSYWPSYNSPVNRRQYQQTRFSWQVKTGGIEQTRPKLILVAYSNQQYCLKFFRNYVIQLSKRKNILQQLTQLFDINVMDKKRHDNIINLIFLLKQQTQPRPLGTRQIQQLNTNQIQTTKFNSLNGKRRKPKRQSLARYQNYHGSIIHQYYFQNQTQHGIKQPKRLPTKPKQEELNQRTHQIIQQNSQWQPKTKMKLIHWITESQQLRQITSNNNQIM
ncbi:Hypothetical_protein [Hexamita inflata]|uniref:Hypothetical_protein n=1 Tax=Hexamita inflata TaxID=28002 RepID=A0AA86THA7_9EUKA|nr:Hypothetical protein HINF_LOCUS5205 [Hexamita inflata]